MKSKILKHQEWTLGFLIIFILIYIFTLDEPSFQKGSLWGISSLVWALLSIGIAIFHHMYVLFSWRLQIHKQTFTKSFKEKALAVYTIGFFIGFFGRIILQFLVGISNRNSFQGNQNNLYIIALIVAFPMFWTFYSVKQYFGFVRAAGADHFDPKYKEMPFVKKGIYKYQTNAMYKYAMFIMWMPGLLFGSVSALLIGLFNHIYVWVHYYTLEKPDWEIIYPKKSD